VAGQQALHINAVSLPASQARLNLDRGLRYANHLEWVASAYQNACRLLVAFHWLAKRVNPGIDERGPGIIAAAAADAPSPLVHDEPRLVIDDRTRSLVFTKTGQLDKLRNKGLQAANTYQGCSHRPSLTQLFGQSRHS
jgi:hypothetical protein